MSTGPSRQRKGKFFASIVVSSGCLTAMPTREPVYEVRRRTHRDGDGCGREPALGKRGDFAAGGSALDLSDSV